MGRTQGAAPARGGEAPGGPHRGPPLGVPDLRGRHPRGPVRRRPHDRLGRGHVRGRAAGRRRVEARSGGWDAARQLPPGAHRRARRQGGVADLPLRRGPARPGRPRAALPRAAADAGLVAAGALRRPGLGLRAEVGRLPGPGAGDLRRHRAAQPHGPGSGGRVRRARRPAPGGHAPGGRARRRGGRDRRRGPARLQRSAERPRALHLRRVRPPLRRRGVAARAALARAARTPGRGGGAGGLAPPHPQRPRRRARHGAVRRGCREGSGGHRRKAGRQPLPPRPARQGVGQDQEPPRDGRDDRRLHRGHGVAPGHARRAAGGRA